METIISPNMQEATDVFVSNLLASEAFVRYHQSQAQLDQDSTSPGFAQSAFQRSSRTA